MIRQSLFYNTCIHSHTTDQFTNIIEPFIEEIVTLIKIPNHGTNSDISLISKTMIISKSNRVH